MKNKIPISVKIIDGTPIIIKYYEYEFIIVIVRIVCLMPIGYPDENKPENSEEEFEKGKIHYEKY